MKVIPRKRKILPLFSCNVNAAKSGPDLVLAWRQAIPSSASGLACSRLAHPALSSHSGPANKHQQQNCRHSLKLREDRINNRCEHSDRFCTSSQNARSTWSNRAFSSKNFNFFGLWLYMPPKLTTKNLNFRFDSRTNQDNPKFLIHYSPLSRHKWKLYTSVVCCTLRGMASLPDKNTSNADTESRVWKRHKETG